MNFEKCFLVGKAISAAHSETPDVALYDQPRGTIDLLIGMGVIDRLVRDDANVPVTLVALRVKAAKLPLLRDFRDGINSAITAMLKDGVIRINTAKEMSYHPPQTDQYTEATLMPDHLRNLTCGE